MKLTICRTSGSLYDQKSPHDNAEVACEERLRPFYGLGTKRVSRYFTIEINSIEDILKLADITSDGIVIYKTPSYLSKYNLPDYTIEIYDGYRE